MVRTARTSRSALRVPCRLTAGTAHGGDRGDASIQMAIVFPFVILLTLTVVQVGMWFHARNVALAAAREGVTAGRTYQADSGQGAARAREVLGRIAGDSLHSPAVSTAGSNAETMRITVTGTAPSLLPGVSGLHVSQSATGARERWTAP
ncbi:TadE family protein [Streptomyces sp. NPDC088354]|uniref:TadE family protein n=1 Tax=Streptomyces sp. NPDC088354 TaxID=3365856 RepID=UPI00382E5FF2